MILIPYILLELIASFYIFKFGLRFPEKQPLQYVKVKKILVMLRNIVMVSTAIYFVIVNNYLLSAMVILFTLIVDQVIFYICKRRQKTWLIKMYTDRDQMKENVMTKQEAGSVAESIVTEDIKTGKIVY